MSQYYFHELHSTSINCSLRGIEIKFNYHQLPATSINLGESGWQQLASVYIYILNQFFTIHKHLNNPLTKNLVTCVLHGNCEAALGLCWRALRNVQHTKTPTQAMKVSWVSILVAWIPPFSHQDIHPTPGTRSHFDSVYQTVAWPDVRKGW
jgi:hypothetical protein